MHVKPGNFLREKTQFKSVHIDLVGPLPESSGHKYILTEIDWASHYTIAVLLQSTETPEVWKAFEEDWIAIFGVPAVFRQRISVHIGLYARCFGFTVKQHKPIIWKPTV